jgi:cytochrome oxidase Cu insertion factor (SCO1/SenC/PrrC family)
MRTNQKHYCLILAFLVLLLAGAYACQKDQKTDSADRNASGAQAGPGIAELLASMNMYHFTEPVEAPEFELESLDGNKVSLSRYRGNVVLLSFWATW